MLDFQSQLGNSAGTFQLRRSPEQVENPDPQARSEHSWTIFQVAAAAVVQSGVELVVAGVVALAVAVAKGIGFQLL